MRHDLDALGLLCPLPVLKLRKRLQAVAVGDVVALHADDPAAIVDVPHFCAESGHKLIDTQDHPHGQTYLVARAK